jgi:serine/threonine protein phosphatase PrpC
MAVVAFGHSDIGSKRPTNDDCLVVDDRNGLYIVADGMRGVGGTAASMFCKMASQQLVEQLPQIQQERSSIDAFAFRQRLVETVQNIYNQTSEAIFQRAHFDESCKGMCTTGTLLALMGHVGIVGHVGDSRAYMVRQQQLYPLTEDHTLLRNLLKRGALNEEQAKSFVHRHVLDRAIGKKPSVESDVMVIDIAPGDRFLLCTKGITKVIKNPAIHRAITEGAPRQGVESLLRLARESGGEDNATAVIVSVSEVQRSTMSLNLRAEEKVAYLRDVFLFQDLDFQEALKFLHVVREVPAARGQIIVREGDVGNEFFVIARGSATASKAGTVVGQIPAGGHFGELALIGDGLRTATVAAAEDSLFLAIARDTLFELLWRERDIGMKLMWRLLQNLGGVVRALNEKLARCS